MIKVSEASVAGSETRAKGFFMTRSMKGRPGDRDFFIARSPLDDWVVQSPYREVRIRGATIVFLVVC